MCLSTEWDFRRCAGKDERERETGCDNVLMLVVVMDLVQYIKYIDILNQAKDFMLLKMFSRIVGEVGMYPSVPVSSSARYPISPGKLKYCRKHPHRKSKKLNFLNYFIIPTLYYYYLKIS